MSWVSASSQELYHQSGLSVRSFMSWVSASSQENCFIMSLVNCSVMSELGLCVFTRELLHHELGFFFLTWKLLCRQSVSAFSKEKALS